VSTDPGAATADRRTLTIALVVMVALVAVGVGSAALLTRSACTRLGASPPRPPATGTAFEADGEAVVAALAAELGPVTGIVEATGARRLAPLADGFAAVGSVTTVLRSDGASATARASFDPAVRIVGDGATLYALAWVNDLTGQLDALVPLTGTLTSGTCVDTATVGTQLAFHLDAGGGQLALLRVDEDGEDARVELRDPVAGRVWTNYLYLGVAPAGVLGDRVSGALTDELVVVTRRSAAPEPAAVVIALERDDGAVRWSVGREAVAELLGSEPGRLSVLAVTATTVVVQVRDDAGGRTVGLVGFDAADGEVAWSTVPGWAGELLDAAVVGEQVALLVGAGAGLDVLALDPRDGALVALQGGVPGEDGRFGVGADGTVVTVTDRAFDVDGRTVALAPLVGLDVLVHPGGTSLLLARHGDGLVVVTFGA
jgi:hypothetical protein